MFLVRNHDTNKYIIITKNITVCNSNKLFKKIRYISLKTLKIRLAISSVDMIWMTWYPILRKYEKFWCETQCYSFERVDQVAQKLKSLLASNFSFGPFWKRSSSISVIFYGPKQRISLHRAILSIAIYPNYHSCHDINSESAALMDTNSD